MARAQPECPAGVRPVRGLALAAAVALLGGCALMPGAGSGTPPAAAVAVPAAWSRSGTAIRATPTGAELQAWWQQLGDPVLDQLIRDALSSAPDLRTAQAKLRQSRASRDLAVANLFPSLSASTSTTRSMTGTQAGGSGNSRTLYAAGFDASWEPSIFGGLSDAARGAEADAGAAAASLEATRVSLAAEVALEYISLRTYQARLAIATANAASQAETLQLTDWRAQAGLATTLDVEQARTNHEQTKASIPGLENGRAQAEHRLAVLTGQPPGTLRSRLEEAKPLPKAPEEVAVGVPADTLRQRPDVRAAQLTLQAEIARTAEQQAARYPTLSLTGSLGWQSLSAAALGGGGGLARSLAASLATTLFDGGRIRSRIAQQDAVQEQALVAYEKSILTALEDVENALAGYATGRQAVEARRQAAVSAGNAAKLARALYQAGATDFQKVLETDRTRLTAEDGLASAESDVLVSVISLYKALGGGWQAAAPGTEEKS